MLTNFHSKIGKEVTFCESCIYRVAKIKIISKKRGEGGAGFVWLRSRTSGGSVNMVMKQQRIATCGVQLAG